MCLNATVHRKFPATSAASVAKRANYATRKYAEIVPKDVLLAVTWVA